MLDLAIEREQTGSAEHRGRHLFRDLCPDPSASAVVRQHVRCTRRNVARWQSHIAATLQYFVRDAEVIERGEHGRVGSGPFDHTPAVKDGQKTSIPG